MVQHFKFPCMLLEHICRATAKTIKSQKYRNFKVGVSKGIGPRGFSLCQIKYLLYKIFQENYLKFRLKIKVLFHVDHVAYKVYNVNCMLKIGIEKRVENYKYYTISLAILPPIKEDFLTTFKSASAMLKASS